MKKYIGVKEVTARPMTLGDYNISKGWSIVDNEDPLDDGYQVKYPDDYVTWCPKVTFEKAHRLCSAMPFGYAVEAMKLGYKVARAGWNGKGMFVVYQKGYPDGIPVNKQTAKAYGVEEGTLMKFRPYMQLKTAQNDCAMWSPSGSDALADDWQIIT